MLRLRVPRPRILFAACLLLAVLAGCGRGDGGPSQHDNLTFEQLSDTSGLSAGEPIVQSLEAYRMTGGAMRVKGRARLPDGARIQVAIRHPGESSSLAMVRVSVQEGVFETPPIMSERGPLPPDRYVFEISAQFVPEWQPPEVLRATDQGRSLRGPGVTRTQRGGAMLWLTQEMKR